MSNSFKTFITNKKYQKVLIPVISIICGFLVGIIIMLFSHLNAGYLFTALMRGVFGINTKFIGTDRAVFNSRYIGEFLVTSMPLILTGLSVAFAYRCGLFNIGAEGQVMMGSLFSIVIAISFPGLPKVVLLPMVVIAGALGGTIWGFIPGLLKAKYNVHEVVVTIMLNYVGLYFLNWTVKSLPGSSLIRTVDIPDAAYLGSEFLSKITNHSRFHWGFIIVIITVYAFYYIMNKTTFGYELRAVGFNKDAAKYAGINVNKNAILAMTISGTFSGLAGTLLTCGTFNYGRVIPAFENYGFNGIVAALIGGNTSIGSVLGGLLFGALQAIQPIMQANGIPREIAIIITSAIIIFVAMQNGIRSILNKIGKTEA